jgi:hypothetical protein
MVIPIHHIITPTTKEIYMFNSFEIGVWEYCGIFYSNRNDETDIWGDEWHMAYAKLYDEELDFLANKYGYVNVNTWIDNDIHAKYSVDLNKLIDKYRPTCNKTLDGRTYYHGMSWSYGYGSDQPKPKMSIEEIEAAILRKTSSIKIKL